MTFWYLENPRVPAVYSGSATVALTGGSGALRDFSTSTYADVTGQFPAVDLTDVGGTLQATIPSGHVIDDITISLTCDWAPGDQIIVFIGDGLGTSIASYKASAQINANTTSGLATLTSPSITWRSGVTTPVDKAAVDSWTLSAAFRVLAGGTIRVYDGFMTVTTHDASPPPPPPPDFTTPLTFYFTDENPGDAYEIVDGTLAGTYHDPGDKSITYGTALKDGSQVVWGRDYLIAPALVIAGKGWRLDKDLNELDRPWALEDASFGYFPGPLASRQIWQASTDPTDQPGIATDKDGNVWAAGDFRSDFDSTDYHLAKFSSTGELQFVTIGAGLGLFYSGLFTPGFQYAKRRHKIYMLGMRNPAFNQTIVEYDIATDTWTYNEAFPALYSGTEIRNISWDEDRGYLWVYEKQSRDWGSGTFTCRAFAFDPDTVDWSGSGSATPTPVTYCDIIQNDDDGPFYTDVTCARVVPGLDGFLLDCWSDTDRAIIFQALDGSPAELVIDLGTLSTTGIIYDIWFPLGGDTWLRLNQREDGLGNRLSGGNAPRIITRSTGNAKSVQRGLRVQTRNGKGYS